MDTFTQALLGATIAQAAFGHRLGPRAMLVGALCGALPDADVVSSLFGPWTSMVHHRGITHSLFFAPVVAAPLGWLGWRLARRTHRWTTWAHLAFWAVVTHPLLDLFTSYGTQLLAPFSDRRFALDAIPIIDPIYSLPLLFAVLLAVVPGTRPRLGTWAARTSLLLTSGYLLLGWQQSEKAKTLAGAQLQRAGFAIQHMRVQPSMLVWMWRIVARDAQGDLRVGVISTWTPRPIAFASIPRPDNPLVQRALDSPRGRLFRWFADDMVGVRIAQRAGKTSVYLDDQRYGLATEPANAFWGARADFNEQGQIEGIERVRHTPRRIGGELGAMWNMIWQGAPTTGPSASPSPQSAASRETGARLPPRWPRPDGYALSGPTLCIASGRDRRVGMDYTPACPAGRSP